MVVHLEIRIELLLWLYLAVRQLLFLVHKGEKTILLFFLPQINLSRKNVSVENIHGTGNGNCRRQSSESLFRLPRQKQTGKNRQIGNKMPLKITKNERFYDLKSFEIVHQTCQISQFFEILHKNACYFSSTNFTVLKQA